MKKIDKNKAAFICTHIARDGLPILLAIRDETDDNADSGWQFLCNVHNEDFDTAQIYSLGEVIQIEPSLEKYIDSPVGTTIMRDDPTSDWYIVE